MTLPFGLVLDEAPIADGLCVTRRFIFGLLSSSMVNCTATPSGTRQASGSSSMSSGMIGSAHW